MIMRNPETGHRFFYPDDREHLCVQYGYRRSNSRYVSRYVYRVGEQGIVFEKKVLKYDSEEQIFVGSCFSAIEIDENGDFKVYNDDDPETLTFNMLEAYIGKKEIMYKEELLNRKCIRNKGCKMYTPKYMRKPESKKQLEEMIKNFTRKYEKYAVETVTHDYFVGDDEKQWFLKPKEVMLHLDTFAKMDDYRWLAERGFAFYIFRRLYLNTDKKNEAFFKKLRKNLEGKTDKDLDADFVKKVASMIYERDFIFELHVIEKMTVKDIKKFSAINWRVSNLESLRTFRSLRNAFGMRNRPPADTLEQIDRLMHEEVGDARYIAIGTLMQRIRNMEYYIGKTEMVSVLSKLTCANDMKEALVEMEKEFKGEIVQNNMDVVMAAGEEGDFRQQCGINKTEEKFGYKFSLVKLDNLEECARTGLNQTARWLATRFDKEDLLIYVSLWENGKWVPICFLQINGKTKLAREIPMHALPDKKERDALQKIGEEYVEKLHACFLNRQLVNLP